MAHVLPETDTFSASVTVPDDGDVANATSVNGPFSEVTDRSRYLYNRQVLAYPENLSLTPLALSVGTPPTRAIVETVALAPLAITYSATINLAVEDLLAGDWLKITGSIQVGATVGGLLSASLGSVALGAMDGWMQPIDPASPPSHLSIVAAVEVTPAMVPSFAVQLGFDCGAVAGSIEIMSPYNIFVERFRK